MVFDCRKKRIAAISATLFLLCVLLIGCGSDKEKTDISEALTAEASRLTAAVTEESSETAWETETQTETQAETEKTKTQKNEPPKPQKNTETDILGLKNLRVGGTDYAGNKIVTVDREEGLFISEIEGKTEDYGFTYRGYIMLIDDPSRVFVGMVPEGQKYGSSVAALMENNGGAIAGCNASGFADPNECGGGNDLVGFCMASGKTRGSFISSYPSIVLTKDNCLKCGLISDWEKEKVRDGMQFGPTLLRDGKEVKGELGGYVVGDHPRTAIGQRGDGAMIFLVIDGRVEKWSAGCSMKELTKIMLAYDAENAGCCDGGSSCVLVYDDAVINKNSAAKPEQGRLIPNAFLVKSKKK